jgi:hypothetical protein
MELEFFLLPTVSRPVSLGIGPPIGTFDQILVALLLFVWQLRYSAFNASSLTRKRVCSLQCNHSLVRAVTPNNYTLPSHLRLGSLFVASYESQGYGGSILSRLHTSQSQSRSHITTDSQSASPSWCQVPVWDPRIIFLSPWDFLLDSYCLLWGNW